jgi:hypothetical protein
MPQHYEKPDLTVVGSVREMTQANLFGESSDNLTYILPILGDNSYS